MDFKVVASPETPNLKFANLKFALRGIKEENKQFTYALRKDEENKENKEKEKNEEKEVEQVVHKFNQSESNLPYTLGSFLHDVGVTLATLVPISLTIGGIIAAVLHDHSLAKSLFEAGGVIWWVGFFMMILGHIKREREGWFG